MQQQEGALSKDIVVTLKPKRHKIVNKYVVIKLGDDIQKPDIDLLIYSKSRTATFISASPVRLLTATPRGMYHQWGKGLKLTREEYQVLRRHFGTLERGKHSKYLPYAFTEQGVAMLSFSHS